jgi:protein tyrosine phosphatase (PTP) superfamily phosphohydrolase (DUF442 family)
MLKPLQIIGWRLRHHGLWVTIQWLYGRGLPRVTGKPVMRYSKITDNVYVGPQYKASGLQWLDDEGINAVINMRIEYDNAEHGLAPDEYLYLPTIDDDAPTIEHLEEGVAFCERIIADGGKVYIHCKGGIGRAPTMAAAYFISQGMSIDEALELIRKTRPFIKVMPPQMAQLNVFEERLNNEKEA